MFFSLLTDKLVLQPTRHTLPTEGKTRRLVEFEGAKLEVWVQRTNPGAATSEPELFILKLPGKGGRAERASPHPAEVWSEASVEIWAFNPPGYGGSGGRATLKTFLPAVHAVFREFERAAAGRPKIVTGNSLGTTTALALAAEHSVHGLLLRNPPPLRELIVGEYGWWNLSLAARLVARHVPRELDSIANAARASAPAVFVSSGRDRLVPQMYQRRIIEAYAGASRVQLLAEAGHACPLAEHEIEEYRGHLEWLKEQVCVRGQDASVHRVAGG
jgi:pimeloyl-ACP methyl ester carboxylesterase